MNYDLIATWSQVISAVIFMGVLVWLWMKFIQPAVLSAQENANRTIAQAERHRDESKAALETLDREIEGARRDAVAIVSRADEQAEHERAQALAEARVSGERLLQNAEGELARARAAARTQLRTDLLDRALGIARTEAELRVNENVNARLIERFVASLERNGRN